MAPTMRYSSLTDPSPFVAYTKSALPAKQSLGKVQKVR